MVKAVTVHDVHAMQQRGESFVLIDVREPHEHAIAFVHGAQAYPMSQAATWLAGLDPQAPTVVMCHHGGRSASVAQALVTRFGFQDVSNMEGGIDAWSCEVDTAIPRY